MVHNQLIACNICETEINLRAQIGYFNIPFNLYCPTCTSHISGKLIIDQENVGLTMELVGAHKAKWNDASMDFGYHNAELSAEFPTKKMYVRRLEELESAPFLRNFSYYDDYQKAIDATRKASQFANFMKEGWRKTVSHYELFWNGHSQLLYPKLTDEVKKYSWIPFSEVTNDLDAVMAMHQMLLTTTGVSFVLRQKTLSEYCETASLIVNNQLSETINFINGESLDLSLVEKKAIRLLESFVELAEQLIPVIALRSVNCLDRVDKTQYGIMTTGFEILSDFYAKSYEWILDNIDILIGLNNIAVRGQYEKCIGGKHYCDLALLASKYKKLELYLEDSEPFSKPASSLKNRIRNAIQHFDDEIDYSSQRIIFTDSHAGRVRKEELYLIDFADLCLDNFSLIFYILELVYNLRKIEYSSQGEIPSCV